MIAVPRETGTDVGQYPAELRDPAPGAESACRVCGQRRGRRDPDAEWVEDMPLDPRGPRERPYRDQDGNLVETLKPQPWRWRHTACTPTAATIVAGVLGLHVDEATARKAVTTAEVGTGRTENAVDRRPWAFVTREQRELLRREVEQALAAGLPRRHVAGRCAVCGRSRSLRWWSSEVTWPDGRGVTCDGCHDVEVGLADRYDEHARRHAHLAVFAGLSLALGRRDDYGLKFAAEVLPEAERHDDHAQPWTYRPAQLAAVRARARLVQAHDIENELERRMAVQLLRVKRARAAADQAAAEAAESGAEVVVW